MRPSIKIINQNENNERGKKSYGLLLADVAYHRVFFLRRPEMTCLSVASLNHNALAVMVKRPSLINNQRKVDKLMNRIGRTL